MLAVVVEFGVKKTHKIGLIMTLSESFYVEQSEGQLGLWCLGRFVHLYTSNVIRGAT